jgi:hypothetical protein
MENTLEILYGLRKRTAALGSLLMAFSRMRGFSPGQDEAIETAVKGLLYFRCEFFGRVRKAYGDTEWQRLEEIDNLETVGIEADRRMVLETIIAEARDLHRNMLMLPGIDGAKNGGQSKAVSGLLEGFECWRKEDLAIMTGSLKD